MKSIQNSILLVFYLLMSTGTSAQDGISWSDPIPVASSSFGDDSPRIELLSDDSPVVLWGKAGINAKIYFSRLDNGTFIDPVEVGTNGIGADIYGFGGLDLATFADQVYVVFENFNNGIFLVRSTDGGNTFELPVSVFDPPPGDWATLPSVAADDNGNPLVSVIRELTNETQARYIMMRSTDGGASFQSPVVASELADGDFVCECCPSDIHTSGDNVWIIYRNNDNNLRDMWVSRSTDGADSFDAATDVDDTDWVISACPISGPKIAPLGSDSLITAWMSGASDIARVSFSTLHGTTMEKGWEYEFPQFNTNAQQRRPDIAGSNDTIGLVWEESGFGVNATDLMFAFSKNGTVDLTANVVNLTDAIGNQRYPALTYRNGFFHLVHTDASGSLLYRKGTVTEFNATGDVANPALQMEVFPLPVTDGQVQVRFPVGASEITSLILLNATGQVVQQWSPAGFSSNSVTTLNLKNLGFGVYFLQVQSDRASVAKKLIID